MTKTLELDRLQEPCKNTWKIHWPRKILKSNLSEGDLIKVSHKKGTEELILKVVPAKKEAKEAKEKKE